MLLTGLGWERGLVLETRSSDGDKQVQEIGRGKQLALSVSEQRYCIGYRPPQGLSLLPCPEKISGLSGYQCPQCLERAMNLPCLRCVGDYCRNPARRQQCVVADNHALYLAAFSDQDVKVGVARWNRRQQRIAEQGARAGIIIARDDGQMIRRHEAQIRSLGLPDRLSLNSKLRALSTAPEQDLIQLLHQTMEGLQRRMRAPWIEPQIAEIEPQPILPRPRLVNPRGLNLVGQVVANWGQIIVINDPSGELVAVDGTALIGHQLGPLPPGSTPNYQPALFPLASLSPVN